MFSHLAQTEGICTFFFILLVSEMQCLIILEDIVEYFCCSSLGIIPVYHEYNIGPKEGMWKWEFMENAVSERQTYFRPNIILPIINNFNQLIYNSWFKAFPPIPFPPLCPILRRTDIFSRKTTLSNLLWPPFEKGSSLKGMKLLVFKSCMVVLMYSADVLKCKCLIQ